MVNRSPTRNWQGGGGVFCMLSRNTCCVQRVVVDVHVPIYKHKDPEYNNISFHSLHKIMQGVLRFTNLAKPNSGSQCHWQHHTKIWTTNFLIVCRMIQKHNQQKKILMCWIKNGHRLGSFAIRTFFSLFAATSILSLEKKNNSTISAKQHADVRAYPVMQRTLHD